jgi:hypothetical protein
MRIHSAQSIPSGRHLTCKRRVLFAHRKAEMRNSLYKLQLLSVALGFCMLLHAGTPGSFRGTIVGAASGKNWIYVQGRNGTARRVEISRARITYDADVPAAARDSHAADALVAGAEVRVTAEQSSDGEWRASRIEILKTAANTQRSSQDQQ